MQHEPELVCHEQIFFKSLPESIRLGPAAPSSAELRARLRVTVLVGVFVLVTVVSGRRLAFRDLSRLRPYEHWQSRSMSHSGCGKSPSGTYERRIRVGQYPPGPPLAAGQQLQYYVRRVTVFSSSCQCRCYYTPQLHDGSCQPLCYSSRGKSGHGRTHDTLAQMQGGKQASGALGAHTLELRGAQLGNHAPPLAAGVAHRRAAHAAVAA